MQGAQGGRPPVHPEGRGAPCPSCLFRHIPESALFSLSQHGTSLPRSPTDTRHNPCVLQGWGEGDDVRSVIAHPLHPRASRVLSARLSDTLALQQPRSPKWPITSQEGRHHTFNSLQVIYLIIKKKICPYIHLTSLCRPSLTPRN